MGRVSIQKGRLRFVFWILTEGLLPGFEFKLRSDKWLFDGANVELIYLVRFAAGLETAVGGAESADAFLLTHQLIADHCVTIITHFWLFLS